MRNRTSKDEGKRKQNNGSRSFSMNKMSKNKKNKMRMGGGGGGLSLESFANAKLKSDNYNPALIKKQREFYKNAKYVNKYKKTLKQQSQQNDHFLAAMPLEDEIETGEGSKTNKTNSSASMRELYDKKYEKLGKARIEKEAIIQAKKAEREEAEAHRKAKREKMFKRTRFGQPIMKHRIEHLLQTIQASSENAANK